MTKEERKEYNKRYYERNKDKIKEHKEANKEQRKKYIKKYCINNKDKIKEQKKKYSEKNKNKIKEQQQKYRDENKNKRRAYLKNNKEKIKEQQKKYNLINEEKIKKYREENKVKVSEQRAEYYQLNKEKIKNKTKEYYKNRRLTDPIFKTKTNYMNSINSAIRRYGYTKTSRTHEILGCSYEEFHKHLENQFEDWMNWDNRGLYKKGQYNFGWDVDHIVPTSLANTEEELIKLFHYTNLRPLCSKINRDEKKNKI